MFSGTMQHVMGPTLVAMATKCALGAEIKSPISACYFYMAIPKAKYSIQGVGVIIKLCFAIFAAFKESFNDLESRSEVIQGHRFWYQSNARIHIPILVVNSNLDPILHSFRDTAA